MVTQLVQFLAFFSKNNTTQEPEKWQTKTFHLQPTHEIILRFDANQHKIFLCKLAILHINRTIKFRFFYLLEDHESALMGKRHWGGGDRKAIDKTWEWKERRKEQERTKIHWLWLINWFLMRNMPLHLNPHKKFMMKIS